jgi:hypothetical protein
VPEGIDCAAGDNLKTAVTGDAVAYERNDKVFYTSEGKPTFPLLVDTSSYHQGAKATGVKMCTAVATCSKLNCCTQRE